MKEERLIIFAKKKKEKIHNRFTDKMGNGHWDL